jgi:transposase-like protein
MPERIVRETRRQTRVVGSFPDRHSAVMLVAARLRHVAGTRWGTRQYMDMERLREQEQEEREATIAWSMQPDLGFPPGGTKGA